MDNNPPMSSPPSILVCDFNSHHDRRRRSSSSKSAARNISAQAVPSPPGPMAIPNAKEPLAPPPLPPPRYIEDLAIGHDSGWKWGNSFEEGEFGKPTLPPIKPSSSLLGGHTRPGLVRRNETVCVDKDTNRSSTMPVAQVSPELKGRSGFLTSTDTPFPNSLTSSLPSPQLQGEKPLSEKSVERSSNAYDQHLLSKIGKPNSPPRSSVSLGSFGQKEFATLPFHSKNRSGLSSLSIGDGSLSPLDAAYRWTTTPQSAGISPGTRPQWTDYVSYRSPSVDSTAPHQLDFRDRNHSTGTHHTNEDSGSLQSRSNRGSYDQGVFPDSDIEFPMDESAQSRQLSIDDRTSAQLESTSPLSRQGMKRRASSPPREAVSDELHALHTSTSNGDLDQRRTTGFPFNGCTSPGARYQPSHGSISSLSSASLRTGSYASSTGLSAAASSMTSMSSLDRPSPGGISPTTELEPSYEKGFVGSGPRKSLPGIPSSRSSLHRDSIDVKGAPPTRNMSLPNALSVSKVPPPRLGRLHICECCPKKPKKFETAEDLRSHEMEKQYTCQFCNKRFKNKNEAERHQNSLHLRRHSWSCAALSGYEAAFHPSASPNCQSPTGPSHDTCGYCGDEFTNFPQPDWDRRIEHLTNVHKFGECNQAKKFYRADHFRQHLKHSHAGASGKWTNILENACMKEESSTEGGLASIGEHSGRSSENHIGDGIKKMDIGNGPTSATRISHTIDEVMEEP
ncbi:hypothetical protein AJ79_01782 [Helicocarpus griseus UAMH5409]|uniref:C2H2-type domain-containing protein n=1 Tax=Helicocarpus griseus UAMH5409 TaxID=1447875 RepID=A0A2B7Y620_9EURO|nr:hypothetical protein AJ79_01782 [Helicocarpus griseus UAMH5409]